MFNIECFAHLIKDMFARWLPFAFCSITVSEIFAVVGEYFADDKWQQQSAAQIHSLIYRLMLTALPAFKAV